MEQTPVYRKRNTIVMLMKKGQFFVLAAFIIVFTVVGLQNAYYYSTLPVLTEQARLSDFGTVSNNIAEEIVTVIMMDPLNGERLEHFLNITRNFTQTKNYGVCVTKDGVETCT